MGRKFTVTAPVEGHNGPVGSLLFHRGHATADEVADAATLAYCRRRGYRVEATGDDIGDDTDGNVEFDGDATGGEGGAAEQDAPPAKTATKPEWVEYAVTKRGADRDEAEALTKGDLIEKYGTKGSTT
jgi:hypothetical protein